MEAWTWNCTLWTEFFSEMVKGTFDFSLHIKKVLLISLPSPPALLVFLSFFLLARKDHSFLINVNVNWKLFHEWMIYISRGLLSPVISLNVSGYDISCSHDIWAQQSFFDHPVGWKFPIHHSLDDEFFVNTK